MAVLVMSSALVPEVDSEGKPRNGLDTEIRVLVRLSVSGSKLLVRAPMSDGHKLSIDELYMLSCVR
jgi:hypothetical protein